ncbi:hypothetical protein VYU27_010238, partial [Nannochloropsis oceanica]
PQGAGGRSSERKYRAHTFLAGNIDALRLRDHDGGLEGGREGEEEGGMEGEEGEEEEEEEEVEVEIEGLSGGKGGRVEMKKRGYSAAPSSSPSPVRKVTFVGGHGGREGGQGGGVKGGGAALPASPLEGGRRKEGKVNF